MDMSGKLYDPKKNFKNDKEKEIPQSGLKNLFGGMNKGGSLSSASFTSKLTEFGNKAKQDISKVFRPLDSSIEAIPPNEPANPAAAIATQFSKLGTWTSENKKSDQLTDVAVAHPATLEERAAEEGPPDDD
eukprot:CAMPEP_0182429092 /NCGR_PEP_ID=MMETSP1167-20130531/25513_1 /TAXON_ID=2988 /ORGANISM="Mallomonas Sp, Strain CCMP3275" /LENGTH=130 /DNA_ID=CAMNT_0024612425 /DNA_START=205 /DNA_END=597 /DNA_ORIENTATION=-